MHFGTPDFNSRPSARGDNPRAELKGVFPYFNSRPSARGDAASSRNAAARTIFQFTPLREGRRDFKRDAAVADDFNSRPSARGDDKRSYLSTVVLDFNSRPSARGDLEERFAASAAISISIHAPPRGATHRHVYAVPLYSFQFTPLREGRRAWVQARSALRAYFNSRPSARGDMLSIPFYKSDLSISIHAPPRGATHIGPVKGKHLAAHFNSRPSARGDPAVSRVVFLPFVFQFTPLREGRHHRGAAGSLHRQISIHAPPRGATGSLLNPPGEGEQFQFTPLREGRPPRRRMRSVAIYFNSRPSARGDGKRYAISANLLFNPYKSAWLNNSATQFVEIILVIFHRIIA